MQHPETTTSDSGDNHTPDTPDLRQTLQQLVNSADDLDEVIAMMDQVVS